MAKIVNDKYYTPSELAQYVVSKTKEVIGEDNITEYIEPSAGAGVFLDYLDKPYLAYDIEPEDDRIVKQDFLKLELEYKKGRCVIGNPPYGEKNNLCVQFYKYAIKLGDYISFIMPISQYKNNVKCYEFDMIHTEDLEIREYSDRKVHCCLNIYKRPIGGLNKKPNYKLKDIEIKERIKNKNPKRNKEVENPEYYDLRLLAWGTGKDGLKLGSFLDDTRRQYSKEFFIKIHNKRYKYKIIELFRDVDWCEEYKMTATPNLLQWQVYKYLKEQIPELE